MRRRESNLLLGVFTIFCLSGPSEVTSARAGSAPRASYTDGRTGRVTNVVARQVLVKLRPDVTGESREQLWRRHRSQPASHLLGSQRRLQVETLIPAEPDRDLGQLVAELRADPAVAWAEPNFLLRSMAGNPQAASPGQPWPDDPLYPEQWGLRAIRAPEAWEITKGDPLVVVAILDTGVDLTHPELRQRLSPGYDFVNEDASPDDDNGHGTFCAGIIGAEGNNGQGIVGVAPRCTIMPVKVLDSGGQGTYGAVAEGLIYAADRGARVINMSFGGEQYSHVLRDAVDYALAKGCVLIAAAGNDGSEEAVYPAAYAEVIGVAASGPAGAIWRFSNRGPHVDTAGPGEEIVSLSPGGAFAVRSGTSAAAAFLSGTTAMLFASRRELAGRAAGRVLLDSCPDQGPTGPDETSGIGVIDARAALEVQVMPFHDVAVAGITLESTTIAHPAPLVALIRLVNLGTYHRETVDLKIWRDDQLIESQTGVNLEGPVVLRVAAGLPADGTALTVRVVIDCAQDDYPQNNQRSASWDLLDKPPGGVRALLKNRPFVHSWVAYQAATLLPPESDLSAELRLFLWDGATDDAIEQYFFDPANVWEPAGAPVAWLASSKAGTSIIEGTWEEDEDDYIRANDVIPNCGFCRKDSSLDHFWNPDHGYDGDGARWNLGDIGLPNGESNHSAVFRAQRWWEEAVAVYPQNPARAYYLLGRVVHLLGDMGVPEHVHLDGHPGKEAGTWLEQFLADYGDFSNYEEYTARNYFEYLGAGAPIDIQALPLRMPTGWLPAGDDADLARLFYNMAHFTQLFDSSSVDGEAVNSAELGRPPEAGYANQSYGAFAYLQGANGDCVDPGTTPRFEWRLTKAPAETSQCTLREGPSEENPDHYVDISRAYGLVALSDQLSSYFTGDDEHDTYIDVTYQYRGDPDRQYRIERPAKPADRPAQVVPDRFIRDQAAAILPLNIRYVAALYQLFWVRTHPSPPGRFHDLPRRGTHRRSATRRP